MEAPGGYNGNLSRPQGWGAVILAEVRMPYLEETADDGEDDDGRDGDDDAIAPHIHQPLSHDKRRAIDVPAPCIKR